MNTADQKFIDEALSIIEKGQNAGITLRLLGSIAYRVHCPSQTHLFEVVKRALTDIDFVAYSAEKERIVKFFDSLGYEMDEGVRLMTEGDRFFYRSPVSGLGIDVFFDKLDYCHPIHFRNRLHKDSPTIPLTDLVLEKMQIVQINEKDLKDLMVLLLEHRLGSEDEKEVVNVEYICNLLKNDWGFCYTLTQNLGQVERYLARCNGLTAEDQEDVRGKLNTLRESIEQTPKTLKWKMRASVGTKAKWYHEVEEKGGIDMR